MVGKGSVAHNDRDFTAKNVDKERTQYNVVYCNENLKEVYHKLFDDAVERYNAKQTRKDRKIDNYYEKIRTGKQEKLFHEVIFQIGNMDDMNAQSENGQIAKTVLDEYMKSFQERNPNLYVFSAHLHMDEATPHLHIDFVPFTTGSKRGLDTRVSLKKALAAQGFEGGTKSMTEWNQWVGSEKEKLSEIMLKHGIEWERKGTHEKHKSVDVFKKEALEKEVEKLEDKKEELKSDISKFKGAEEYALAIAKKVEADELKLPEPSPLMPAKKYKSDIVMPFIAKLIKTMKNLARRVFVAEKNAQKMQEMIQPLQDDNNRLKKLNWDKSKEIINMKSELNKFNKIKEYFDVDKINDLLRQIDSERKLSRKHDRTER
ncbi:MAG: recombinase [Ruminococcaceae bacterium]|nr:recombinase [Oscillospiraceae bacterium]